MQRKLACGLWNLTLLIAFSMEAVMASPMQDLDHVWKQSDAQEPIDSLRTGSALLFMPTDLNEHPRLSISTAAELFPRVAADQAFQIR